jgi:hypothetical protein
MQILMRFMTSAATFTASHMRNGERGGSSLLIKILKGAVPLISMIFGRQRPFIIGKISVITRSSEESSWIKNYLSWISVYAIYDPCFYGSTSLITF